MIIQLAIVKGSYLEPLFQRRHLITVVKHAIIAHWQGYPRQTGSSKPSPRRALLYPYIERHTDLTAGRADAE